MRSASYSIAFIILSLCVATDAQAGVLRCATKTITRPDFERMRSVARRVAGVHRLKDRSLWVCMNPGRGLARYELEREPQPDESIAIFTLSCNRGDGPWSCELFQSRQTSMQIEQNGRQKTLEFGIPDDMDVAEARRFVRLAMSAAPGLTTSQTFGAKPGAPDSDRDRQALKDLKASFDVENLPAWGRVSREQGGTVEVNFNEYAIRFKQTTDSREWIVDCWLEYIVVT